MWQYFYFSPFHCVFISISCISIQQSLTVLVPRVWPFLHHTISSVRKAALETLFTLLSTQDQVRFGDTSILLWCILESSWSQYSCFRALQHGWLQFCKTCWDTYFNSVSWKATKKFWILFTRYLYDLWPRYIPIVYLPLCILCSFVPIKHNLFLLIICSPSMWCRLKGSRIQSEQNRVWTEIE